MARKKKRQEGKKRTKKNSSILEYEIMKMMEACLKQVINTSLDEIIKE